MATLSKGKYAQAISDQSGQAFPYNEMVTQWDGLFVHYSEVDPKHPQLEPKPVQADGQGLPKARPQRVEPPVLILLNPNPFQTIKYSGNTYVNVYSPNHGRSSGDVVRFRGPTSPTGFYNVPTFDGVSDISNASGFTITVGKIDSSGNVSGTSNYFYFQSSDTASNGNINGGRSGCSAGPVNLQA
jgi:hypothetical protein